MNNKQGDYEYKLKRNSRKTGEDCVLSDAQVDLIHLNCNFLVINRFIDVNHAIVQLRAKLC